MTDEHYPTEPTLPEPTAPEAEVVKETTLHRSTKRRMIGGVAGGIGERFDIDPNIVRVIFVVLTVLYGSWASGDLSRDVGHSFPSRGAASDGDWPESERPRPPCPIRDS